MPRYRNDGTTSIGIEGTDGSNISLAPGEEGDTNLFFSISNLTKISDAPYYNRVINRQTITLGAAQDVTISLNTDWILIYQITDDVTVYRQHADNTPPEYDAHTDSDPVIQIPAKGTLTNLVVSGTGTCEVVEYKE